MFRRELTEMKRDYDGTDHPFKLRRSPSEAFELAENLQSPKSTMNGPQQHNQAYTDLGYANGTPNFNVTRY